MTPGGVAVLALSLGLAAAVYQRRDFHNCPEECVCSNGPQPSAVCSKGGLDESAFQDLLATLPSPIKALRVSAPPHRPNHFSVTLDLLRFKELEELELVNCGLRSLGKRVFAGLKGLRVLNVAGNRISYLSPETFEGTPQLWHLNLASNHLHEALLPTGAFAHLKALKSLDLSENRLTQFPGNLLLGLRSLARLSLDGARVEGKALAGLLSDTPKLKSLSLRNASLSEALDASAFAGVPLLQELRLAGSGLEELPSAALSGLGRLRSLDLAGNRIASLHPFALADLPASLQSLSLSGNRLGGLQAATQHHPRAVNRLEEYGIHPLALANSSLVSLDLSNNGYAYFSSRVLLAGRAHLRILSLSGNPLGGVEADQTRGLALHVLHVAGIGMPRLPRWLPPAFANLHLLNISGNPLSDIPATAAAFLRPALRQLDISRCRFTSIGPHLEKLVFGQLEKAFLGGNPWDCRCHLRPTIAFLQRREGAAVRPESAMCRTPRSLAGQEVRSLGPPPDCAVLFGAASGLTQKSEIGILVAAVLSVLLLVGIGGMIGCYARVCSGGGPFGRSYRTREGSRGHLSPSSSEPSETNSLHPPLPPPSSDSERLF